ncbi:hypothetical protein HU200_000146 [Digitaria exilis]|uniref:Phytocyanin domain-containing protein n=1 Tax=Digitaria exilis TaxID=1010633 RepID=A0A835G205_9POAL|nr:hypothetical protein HU200_000146 [Digitaria exilis]
MASSSALALACFAFLAATAGATQYKVGGDNGWAVPDASAESFNTWAEKTSFQIGDELCKCLYSATDSHLHRFDSFRFPCSSCFFNLATLTSHFLVAVFVYPKDKDSVLLVEPADYNTCNTTSYDKQFTDGSTTFTLDHAGAYFFISGVEANCRANEKLIVMVSGEGPAAAPAGAPPSSGGGGKAPPSSSASSKSPAPKNSKGAPSSAKGDKNGAAGLTVAGFAASVVGCIAYAMLAF